MSVFNTRKDRFANGKPKPHKVKYPDNYPPGVNYLNKSPAWWNRMHTTTRRRTADRQNLHQLRTGRDPDGIAWHPDNYPTPYYW